MSDALKKEAPSVHALMELHERLALYGDVNLYFLMLVQTLARIFRDASDMYAELWRVSPEEIVERVQLDDDLEVAALTLVRKAEESVVGEGFRVEYFAVRMLGREVYRFPILVNDYGIYKQ